MIINKELCIGCEKCVPYCPMGAISIKERSAQGEKPKKYAEIDRDECVECYVCFRADVCPKKAIEPEELTWPRVIRRAFSDPFFDHRGTNVPGRGTEEMKTNEVTGRYKLNQVGVGLEFGRPGVGVRLKETEKAIMRFTQMGITLEEKNPLTQLIEDRKTGKLRSDVLNEKVLSAIVEFVIPAQRLAEVLKAIEEISSETETVFSLDLISRVRDDGTIPILDDARRLGIKLSLNGKVNVGLGRPLFVETTEGKS